MARNIPRLLIALTLLASSCGIRGVDQLPLPGGETAIYVRSQTRFLGMAMMDRWLYDPKTGRTTLVRSDVSQAQPLEESLKKIPLPIIP